MAAKKTVASADVAGLCVAFALRNHSEGDGDNAIMLTYGQRLELTRKEFDALAAKGAVVEGVFVKMKTAVEGGRYSLKPHDTTWLAPHVYKAWKAAGYCEPTQDDPQMGALLKAREDTAREAVAGRDAALRTIKEQGSRLSEVMLCLAAVREQVNKVRILVEPAADSGDVLDDGAVELLSEINVLIDLIPECDVDITGNDGSVAAASGRLI